MDLLFKTKKSIHDHNLIEAGDHVLLGVSGGIDSMVMLDILLKLKDELGIVLSVCHINHRLRGKDSDQDAEFVKSASQQAQLDCHIVDWKGVANQENLQESARDFRQKTFIEVANEIGADRVALAHNMEDQAETILINMIRGSGLEGLCGMRVARPFRENITLIKPLLDISREEITSYAAENSVSYRSDRTNDQTKYTRNFIRHKLLPVMNRLNPAIVPKLSQMADILREDDDYLQEEAERAFEKMVVERDKNRISLSQTEFVKSPPTLRRRILKTAYVALTGSNSGINQDHLLHMDRIAVSTTSEGSYNLHGSCRFEKRAAMLAIFTD